MKKKIMFFMFSLHDGGAQRTVVNIINNLDKRDYEIVLVLGSSSNNIYLEQIQKNIKIHSLQCKKLRHCVFKLAKVIRKEKPSLMFTTLNDNNIVLSISKILSLKSIPLIVREANTRTETKKISKFNKIITKITYNLFATKVVALSQGVERDLIDNFKIKSKKIKVIYNPIEVQNIRVKSEEEVEDFDFNENESTIIAIGRLTEQKDFSTLIKAFKLLNKEKKSNLLILGKGELEKELKDLVAKLNLKERVYFGGYKTNPYKYLKNSDLFVLSSRWEGFGHVIVEAMAAGVPVVSTNCPSGPREILGDNQYGLLTQVGDYRMLAENMKKLLIDDNLYYSYKEKGSKRSEDFKASKIVNQYSELFDEVINQNR